MRSAILLSAVLLKGPQTAPPVVTFAVCVIIIAFVAMDVIDFIRGPR